MEVGQTPGHVVPNRALQTQRKQRFRRVRLRRGGGGGGISHHFRGLVNRDCSQADAPLQARETAGQCHGSPSQGTISPRVIFTPRGFGTPSDMVPGVPYHR